MPVCMKSGNGHLAAHRGICAIGIGRLGDNAGSVESGVSVHA